MVKCSYCENIYEDGTTVCKTCGASLFEAYRAVDEWREEKTVTVEADSGTAETIMTAAGTIAGISLLGKLLTGSPRRSVVPPRPPMHRVLGNPAGGHGGWEKMPRRGPQSSMHRGPQAGPGRRVHGGPHGGVFGSRHGGGRGPMGGPGGRR